DAATIAEILRDEAGYGTMMVGKWHLAKDSDCSAAGSQHSWPCQRGFDRFYGILDAFTNLHQPHRLVGGNPRVQVDRAPGPPPPSAPATSPPGSSRTTTWSRSTGTPTATTSPTTSPTGRSR